MRNDYVHGRWGTPAGFQMDAEGRLDGEPLLGFIPLHWDTSPDQPDQTVQLTMAEFGQQVDEAERLVEDFHSLADAAATWLGLRQSRSRRTQDHRPDRQAPTHGTQT